MKFSINPFKTSMTMSKIETASKLSLKLTSSIKLGRRGARAELSTLDTDHKPPLLLHSPKRANDYPSQCDQIWRKLRTWPHLLKKTSIEDLIPVQRSFSENFSKSLFKLYFNKNFWSNYFFFIYQKMYLSLKHLIPFLENVKIKKKFVC